MSENNKIMKQVISTEKIPIKLWLDDIEEGALQQAKNLAWQIDNGCGIIGVYETNNKRN